MDQKNNDNYKYPLIISIILVIVILFTTLHSNIMNSEERNNCDNNSILVDAKVSNVYSILIDIELCKLTVFKDKVLYKQYPCSGGKYSTPSPIGTWAIIDKGEWGSGFGGSWLGLNVPWGKFGIHGTIYPQYIGSNVSKGCIRLFNRDAAELYKYIPHGTKVVIINGCYGPFGQGFRILKSGMYGSDVMEIQKRLKELGFFHGYINGRFDSSLSSAVLEFKRENKLRIDNNIYPETMNKMGFVLFD